jgi:hypothetical protein
MLVLFIAALCSSQAAAQDASKDLWTDSATGLIWTVNDNGSNINPGQAGEYCTGLRLGGQSDWRLPTADELEALYDKSVSKQFKVKGPIQLSGPCALSSSRNNSGDVWSFCYTYGGRSLGPATGHGSAGRALCVRGAAK